MVTALPRKGWSRGELVSAACRFDVTGVGKDLLMANESPCAFCTN